MSNVYMSSAGKGADYSRAASQAAYPGGDARILLDYSALSVVSRAMRSSVDFVRSRIIEPRRLRARRKAEIHQLRGMTDHNLKDIGLSRSEIVATVCGQLEHPISKGSATEHSLPPRRRRRRLRPAGASPVSASAKRERRQNPVAKRISGQRR